MIYQDVVFQYLKQILSTCNLYRLILRACVLCSASITYECQYEILIIFLTNEIVFKDLLYVHLQKLIRIPRFYFNTLFVL